LQFGFLQAEAVGIYILEEIHKALAKAGPEAVDIP
jgi:hypothetical protein